ncbi:uncharacterized protein [Phyllobates terribilis]|uniref:uncharacterized protein n=1 Tax=Phyllobates terribilis TaxID=111132 RepID=UPI003CCAB9EC
MDFYVTNREKFRLSLINTALSKDSKDGDRCIYNNPTMLNDIDQKRLHGLFLNLENNSKIEITNHVDMMFLEHYIKDNIIPRGLRMNLNSSFPQDIVFTERWERCISDCSTTLIRLLIDKRNTLDMHALETLAKIKGDLEFFSSSAEYFATDNEVKLRLAKFENDLINKKAKKYERDIKDSKKEKIQSPLQISPVPIISMQRTTRDNPSSPILSNDTDNHTKQVNSFQKQFFMNKKQQAIYETHKKKLSINNNYKKNTAFNSNLEKNNDLIIEGMCMEITPPSILITDPPILSTQAADVEFIANPPTISTQVADIDELNFTLHINTQEISHTLL